MERYTLEDFEVSLYLTRGRQVLPSEAIFDYLFNSTFKAQMVDRDEITRLVQAQYQKLSIEQIGGIKMTLADWKD